VTTVMKFIVCLFSFLLIPFSAGAQGPREFPLNTTYKAISISGFDVPTFSRPNAMFW